MRKISDKSDMFLLNYSNLLRGALFSGHSVHVCLGILDSDASAPLGNSA